jgi:hypothetical protein
MLAIVTDGAYHAGTGQLSRVQRLDRRARQA